MGQNRQPIRYVSARAGLRSVSYTHLDVYKRQVNANSKNKELCKELLNSYFEELQESSSHIDELSCYYEAMENGYAVDVCNSNWPSGTENELEQLFIQLIGSDTLNVEDVTEGTQTRLEELIERYGDVKKETYSD